MLLLILNILYSSVIINTVFCQDPMRLTLNACFDSQCQPKEFVAHEWEDTTKSLDSFLGAIGVSTEKSHILSYLTTIGEIVSHVPTPVLSKHFIDCTRPSYVNEENLLKVYKSHTKNLSDKWEQYLFEYDSLFYSYKDQNVRLLEIGVQNGGSLQIWSKYFGLDSQLYGIDINPDVCEMTPLGSNIHVHCFDGSDENKINSFIKNTKSFDIIIDDASHNNKEVIKSFELLFPSLNPGGIYVIEDTSTSYLPQYSGGLFNKNSMIEYFKRLIEMINYFNIPDANFKLSLTKFEQYCVQRVRRISFIDGMIVIEKQRRRHRTPYLRVNSGEVAPINHLINDDWKLNTQNLDDSSCELDPVR